MCDLLGDLQTDSLTNHGLLVLELLSNKKYYVMSDVTNIRDRADI